MPRKQWRTVYPGSRVTDRFPSEKATYDFVDNLRSAWAAGAPAATGALTVQVDEGLGAGWEPCEHISFAEENS
ncbi:MAG TPA: hypothetical protein VI172_14735 [Candidatus Dormibacteraeota bacterium]|jgi:hypothetical protein